MKTRNKIYIVMALLSLSMPATSNAMEDTRKKLYEQMDYTKIFNQQKILKEHTNVLEREGIVETAIVNDDSFEVEPEGKLKKILHAITCGCLRKREALADEEHRYELLPLEDRSEEETQEEVEITEDDRQSNAPKTSADLDKSLVKDFRQKKSSAMKKTLVLPVYTFLVNFGFFGAGSKISGTDTGQGFSMIIMIDVVRRNILDFSKSAYCFFFPGGDPLDKYEELYAKRKRFFPRALQFTIEDNFAAGRASDRTIKEVLNFLKTALYIPLSGQAIKFPTEEEFTELLDGHEPPIRDDIEEKIFNHFNPFSSGKNKPKTILYFVGPTGTRKTYIVEKLADMMGVKLVRLIASSDPEKITGNATNPGSFLKSISQIGVGNNAIIFIDEVDRVLNKEDAPLQLFLPLLEPEAKYFYSPYLEANVDISKFCFLLAGNSPLDCKNEQDKAALNSRIKEIKFDKVLLWRKKEIIRHLVSEMLPERIEQNTSYDELMSQIDECIEHNDDPGVRNLRLEVSEMINGFLLKQYRTQEQE